MRVDCKLAKGKVTPGSGINGVERIRSHWKSSPNRCAPLVLAGRISLGAPSNSAQLATDRKRICAVLKLIRRGRRASPAVPAYRCIHPRHIRRRLPPTANVGLRQLRKTTRRAFILEEAFIPEESRGHTWPALPRPSN